MEILSAVSFLFVYIFFCFITLLLAGLLCIGQAAKHFIFVMLFQSLWHPMRFVCHPHSPILSFRYSFLDKSNISRSFLENVCFSEDTSAVPPSLCLKIRGYDTLILSSHLVPWVIGQEDLLVTVMWLNTRQWLTISRLPVTCRQRERGDKLLFVWATVWWLYWKLKALWNQTIVKVKKNHI